jgi:16S rRNA (uracil1498-N3)-methyltransferase
MDDYRFYVPDLLAQVAINSRGVELPDDQSHHARTVLRLTGGERVVAFDGAGGWATGIIYGEGGGKPRNRGSLRINIEGGVHVDPPPARQLTIVTAVPKGERAEWLIEQASQLNAACVQWIDCDRSVVKPREGGGGQ